MLPARFFMTLSGQPCEAQLSKTSCSGFLTGSILSSTTSIRLKIAVFAPMPSASVSTATAVKPGFFSSWRKANFRSFITQSLHRIDLCSASGGNPRREKPCEDENPGSGEKYNRIGRIHFKEHLLQCLSDGVRKKESPGQAQSDEPQRVLEHEPNYVAPQRAEGVSQSDFAGSARNEISLQSIEPDRGHGESQATERGEENRAGLKHPQQRAVGKVAVERLDTQYRQTAIQSQKSRTNGLNKTPFSAALGCTGFDVQERARLRRFPEWNINMGADRAAAKIVARPWHYSYDFQDRLRFFAASAFCAWPVVVGRIALLRRHKANLLGDGV